MSNPVVARKSHGGEATPAGFFPLHEFEIGLSLPGVCRRLCTRRMYGRTTNEARKEKPSRRRDLSSVAYRKPLERKTAACVPEYTRTIGMWK